MAFITSSVSLHPSYSKPQKDPDGYSACISVKGNEGYEINPGNFMVKLHLADLPGQIIPFCQGNHEIIVHGRLVEFERSLVMTICAHSAKVYPVPKRDFQHPSLLAIAGTIASTSPPLFSGELTWFDISCVGNLTSSPTSSRSQPISGILRNSSRSNDRKSGSTSRSGSTSVGSKKVTFDDIMFPKHKKSGSDDSSGTVRRKAPFCEESYKDDEISGTIKRVGTDNSNYFSSSAPATAYFPLGYRSATFPLPAPRSAPVNRPRPRTGNSPLSDIQVDPRARDFSSHGNRPIHRRLVPRPLFAPVDSFQLSQSNNAGRRIEFQTLDKRPYKFALPNHRAPDPFIPSKISRAIRSTSNTTSKASFLSEAHEGMGRRSEDLLLADIDDHQVDLSVGTGFDGRSIRANDFINPTLQAAGSRYSTLRDRRRGIYGTPVSSIGGAFVPEDIAHLKQHDLVKTGTSTGGMALGSKQAQMKSLHKRRDAAFFSEKLEIEQLKTAVTSTEPSLACTKTTSTTSSEPTLLFTVRCFLPKGNHSFQKLSFSVGQPLAITGELQGFVGEGPHRIASIIVSEIGPYSLGTENAKMLNNCCGVSCTENDPVTEGRPLAALDPVKVENMRDLIGKSRGVDDSLKSGSPVNGAAERRPALSKLRKASSGLNLRSKFTNLFTRSSSRTGNPTPPESLQQLAATPSSATSNEGSSLEHARAGLNAPLAARLKPDRQPDYDVATPWSNNSTRAGLRQAGLRQELPRLRTAEARALARQSLLPKLTQFSPLSMESQSANMKGRPYEAGFSPMTMTPQYSELSLPVEKRSLPLTIGRKPNRDLPNRPPAEKPARSPTLTQRRNISDLKLITDEPFVFPSRTTATDIAADPMDSEASTPITPTTATCTSLGETSLPPLHHQQHPEIPLPEFTPTWTHIKKKRAKRVIKALNSPLPLPLLKYSLSLPSLRFPPSPPLSMRGIQKCYSAPTILLDREQRVFNIAARNLAPPDRGCG